MDISLDGTDDVPIRDNLPRELDVEADDSGIGDSLQDLDDDGSAGSMAVCPFLWP